MKKISLIKFRLWNGKIFLLKEYAYFIWHKLEEREINIERTKIEEKLSALIISCQRQANDFLVEVFFDNSQSKNQSSYLTLLDLLSFEISQISPLNEKLLDKGRVLDLPLEKAKNDKNHQTEQSLQEPLLNLFFVKDGILYYFLDCIVDPLAIYALFLFSESVAIKEIHFSKQSQLFSKSIEEVFVVNSLEGVVSIRKIHKYLLGNSRFYARKLRKMLRERCERP